MPTVLPSIALRSSSKHKILHVD
jgi:hypothetical protein